MVTHALNFLKYADYIYELDQGKVLAEGSFDKMKSREMYVRSKELRAVRVLAKK